MDFKNTNPFRKIYLEMLAKIYEQYLYHSGKKECQLQTALMYGNNAYLSTQAYPLFSSKPYLSTLSSPLSTPNDASSIDDILSQDSREILDKVKNTALSIAYRIKIHGNINDQLDYNWYTIKNEIVGMEMFYPLKEHGTERRRSNLTSELMKVYKNRLDEDLNCWKDLKDEMRYFIHLFHQYKGLRQDMKMIGEN